MREKKINFPFWGSPPSTGTGNDGVTYGVGNPSPEEIEKRQLPTQENGFPQQVSTPTPTIEEELGIL